MEQNMFIKDTTRVQVSALSRNGRAALHYAIEFGFSVFPCGERAKTPLTPNGFKDATTDPGAIVAYWKRNPDANVGIACGHASGGLLVLDVDGEEGRHSLGSLESMHGNLPKTPQVITGKGLQFYFQTPNEFRNRVRLSPGIDIRADGGYVVAPPSTHPNGKTYQWEDGSRIDEFPLVTPPDWLAKLLLGPGEGEYRKKDWSEIARGGAPCGARNQTLASIAGHLFYHRVDPRLAYALLKAWNQQCTERPLPATEFEKTVESIAKTEAARMKRGGKC